MTHEEALERLAVQALGALDEEPDALEEHLERCPSCRAEGAGLLQTAARLGEAVERVAPPAALRAAVLAALPADAPLQRRLPLVPGLVRRLGARRRLGPVRRPGPLGRLESRVPWPALLASALFLAVAGLAVWTVAEHTRLKATRSELALDERGLELLTSTEAVNMRLEPVKEPGAPSVPAAPGQPHGHWVHRPGIPTQVLVIEFMPEPAAGTAYYGWLRAKDGGWRPAGRFSLDPRGHGHLILTGDDGSGIAGVVITRQSRISPAPEGESVLSWPAR